MAAADLGPTSMHEHLLIDARILGAPAASVPPDGDLVTIENLGFIHWNLLALEDNLILDDPELAALELSHARAAGQSAVVDLTGWGLGPRPQELPAISLASGAHIVAGVGVYLDRPHPAWVGTAGEAELVARFAGALTTELDGAGFRAGLIGLVGTSEPPTRSERRVLEAAGAAAAMTGAPVTVRLDPSARRGPEMLEILAGAGCPARQVIFGNVDEFIDPGYLGELADAGATLEWCFGNEATYRNGYHDPSDHERLAALTSMLAAEPGRARSCVLGCSVWTKSQLRHYGGMGYDHLMARIVPELRRAGVDDPQIDQMLTANPARLLDWNP